MSRPKALLLVFWGGWLLAFGAGAGIADTFVSGTISTNTTWTLAGSPYIVTGGIEVYGSPTPVLTIQAGVTVKFNQNTYLAVGYTGPGGIQAIGTSAQRITLTANTASPTPGFWLGIYLHPGTLSSSKIAYATIRYGGSEAYSGGGLHLASSATIDNTTVQNSAYAGMTIIGSVSPSVVSSTVTANPIGVMTWYPATPNLQTVTISSNTGFAVSQDARQTLGTVSGLALTGNGTNAIELRGLGVDVNTTWKAINHPYIVTGGIEVYGAPTPVLTIQAGVTVKFNQNTYLTVGGGWGPGGIQAVGTSAQRITFTANTASPTPGFWFGIQLNSGTLSNSRIAYATISYGGSAGNSGGGIHVGGSSPVIDNVTFQSNAYAGISLNLGFPTISNASFLSNTVGIANAVPANIVSARLSFWGHASGPSGSGPGTGQSVSSGVQFEPWLLAAPSSPQSFTSSVHTNRTFNPALSINTKITAGTAQSGTWTLKIINSGSVVVRTFTGSGTSWTSTWDGKNTGGANQPDGTYSYQLESVAGSATATPAKGRTILDRTKPLTVGSLAVSPAFFSPNADGTQDTSTASWASSFDDTNFTVNVRNSASTIVRTSTSQGASLSYAWNGKNASNVIQPDGAYTFEAIASNGTASATSSATATLDRTLPTATLTAPAANQTLSNVYANGSTSVAITGTATDANLLDWTSSRAMGTAPQPSDYATIATATAPVTAGNLGTWATFPLSNGPYTIKLEVQDKAGNKKQQTKAVTVGNFRASQNVHHFDAASGGTVTYTSIVPFALTETLIIKNQAGQVVRTLVNGTSRSAGTFSDVWNGRNGAGQFLPSGAYLYVVTVTAGANSMTWDLSGQPISTEWGVQVPAMSSPFDPFDNKPLRFTYSLEDVFRTSIQTSSTDIFGLDCAALPPESSCITNFRYEAPGTYSHAWAGTEPTGLPTANHGYIMLLRRRDNFPQNAVVLTGTAPQMSGLVLQPAMWGPALGAQQIAFDLTTHQNQPVTVSIVYLRHEDGAVVRTLSFANQAPGHRSYSFDGRDTAGEWLNPGNYTVTVKVTDGIGNVADSQLMTSVDF